MDLSGGKHREGQKEWQERKIYGGLDIKLPHLLGADPAIARVSAPGTSAHGKEVIVLERASQQAADQLNDKEDRGDEGVHGFSDTVFEQEDTDYV